MPVASTKKRCSSGDSAKRWRIAMSPACAGRSWQGRAGNSQKTSTARTHTTPSATHGPSAGVARTDEALPSDRAEAGACGSRPLGACVVIAVTDERHLESNGPIPEMPGHRTFGHRGVLTVALSTPARAPPMESRLVFARSVGGGGRWHPDVNVAIRRPVDDDASPLADISASSGHLRRYAT